MPTQKGTQIKIGFTCGTFDLLHPGHLLMLREARSQCDYLIVGLHTDPTLDRPDKHSPIETVEERMIRLRSCKYVDEIVNYDTEDDLYWLLKRLNPNIRFMGMDWKNKPNYSRDKLPFMKVIYNSRDHDYSSSNLRKRICESQ